MSEKEFIQLYKDDKTVIDQRLGKKIFICGKCNEPGTKDPVYIQEFENRYPFHARCVFGILKRLKSKMPQMSEQEIEKAKQILEEEKKQVKILEGVPKIFTDPKIETKRDKLKVKKERLKLLLDKGPQKRVMKRFTKNGDGVISYQNGTIFIDHPYDQKLITKYHFLGNIKFDKLLKKWEVKKISDIEICRFLLEINEMSPQYQWTIDPKALEIIENNIKEFQSEVSAHKSLMKLKRQQMIQLDDWAKYLKTEPFGYQKVGIKFLETVNGVGMIGDGMGLGKTLQALGYTAKHNLKTIIVCPASVKYNWLREVKKHTYRTAMLITDLEKPTKRQENLLADYSIINYEQLQKYQNFLKVVDFDCVVVDESQYIKNAQSQRAKLVRKLFKDKKSKPIPHRILLSGTPIKNRPIEFYSQLNFLKPELFRSKESFGLRYCDAQESPYGRGYDYNGASNLRELYHKLDSFYIRRLKENVLKELPKKTINRLDLELTVKERQEYLKKCKEFKSEYLAESSSGEGGKTTSIGISLTKVVKIKHFLSKTKIPMVVDFVKQLLEESEHKKVIIFSNVRESQKELVGIFGDMASSLLGDYSIERRDQEVLAFENNPDKRVFIGSTLAAGVGINLVAADTVIFLDLMWNPADHQQAEDRAFRIGQKNAVSIYYMNYRNTIESMLWRILEKKLDILGQVLDGKDEAQDIDEKTVVSKFMSDFIDSLDLKSKKQKSQ